MEFPQLKKRFRSDRRPFYEVTCKCKAYDYPHRFGGGRCNGSSLVDLIWENGCNDCSMKYFDDWSNRWECYVANGSEELHYCPELQNFLQKNEAYTRKLKKC